MVSNLTSTSNIRFHIYTTHPFFFNTVHILSFRVTLDRTFSARAMWQYFHLTVCLAHLRPTVHIRFRKGVIVDLRRFCSVFVLPDQVIEKSKAHNLFSVTNRRCCLIRTRVGLQDAGGTTFSVFSDTRRSNALSSHRTFRNVDDLISFFRGLRIDHHKVAVIQYAIPVADLRVSNNSPALLSILLLLEHRRIFSTCQSSHPLFLAKYQDETSGWPSNRASSSAPG